MGSATHHRGLSGWQLRGCTEASQGRSRVKKESMEKRGEISRVRGSTEDLKLQLLLSLLPLSSSCGCPKLDFMLSLSGAVHSVYLCGASFSAMASSAQTVSGTTSSNKRKERGKTEGNFPQ